MPEQVNPTSDPVQPPPPTPSQPNPILEWIKSNKTFTVLIVIVVLGWLFDHNSWKKEETDLNQQIKTITSQNTDLQKQVDEHKTTLKKVYDENGHLREVIAQNVNTTTNTNENSNTTTNTQESETEHQVTEQGKIPTVMVYGGAQFGSWLNDTLGVHYRILGNLNVGVQLDANFSDLLFNKNSPTGVLLTLGQQF